MERTWREIFGYYALDPGFWYFRYSQLYAGCGSVAEILRMLEVEKTVTRVSVHSELKIVDAEIQLGIWHIIVEQGLCLYKSWLLPFA